MCELALWVVETGEVVEVSQGDFHLLLGKGQAGRGSELIDKKRVL